MKEADTDPEVFDFEIGDEVLVKADTSDDKEVLLRGTVKGRACVRADFPTDEDSLASKLCLVFNVHLRVENTSFV